MKQGNAGMKKGPKKSPAKAPAASNVNVASRREPSAHEAEKAHGAPAMSSETPATPRTQVVDEEPKLPVNHGKIGVFGGPRDRGIKPDDKLALPTGPHGVYERVRNLNPKSFYCSMRWNYHVNHMTPEEVKRWWANKKLLLANSKNGSAVVVRAVDYGPHENTGLDLGISPGAADALGVEAGDEVDITFADPKSPLGPQ